MKLYKVFSAGKHGKKYPVTEADLQEIANNYDVNFHEAPLTTDHKDYGGALGWVSNVIAKGKDLYVEFKEVSDEAKLITSNGKYKRPSIEIAEYEDKGQYLRAVSLVLFPAVKGLPAIQFCEDGSKILYSDFEINFDEKKNKNKIMDIKKYADKIGIESTEAEAVLQAYDEKLSQANAELSVKIEELKLKDAEIEQFSEKMVDSMISNALKSGKIVEAQKDAIKTFAQANKEACQKYLDSLAVNTIYNQNSVSTKTKTEAAVTYAEIIKDPKLARGLDESTISELRNQYFAN